MGDVRVCPEVIDPFFFCVLGVATFGRGMSKCLCGVFWSSIIRDSDEDCRGAELKINRQNGAVWDEKRRTMPGASWH